MIEDPEDMPLFPLCDQPILEYEEALVTFAFGMKALVHRDCEDE